jgi:transposase-like protein
MTVMTPEEAKAILASVARHGNSVRALAQASGISRSTWRSRVKRARSVLGEAVTKPDTVEEPESNMARLRQQVRGLEARLKEIHRDNLDASEVRRTIMGLVEPPAEVPDWVIKPGSAKKNSGVPCAIWSDWHLGETVDPAQVNGINEFNLTIAEQRIRRLVERTIDLCLKHMVNPQYPGFVVNLLGDIVSGDIHEELEITNELPLLPVVLWARDRLVWAIRQLANAFGHVLVVCAPGNHGRKTKKPRAKGYVHCNYDWLIYQLLDRAFHPTDDKGNRLPGYDNRVRFLITDSGEVLYRVFDVRYLAVHGDDLGVKGGDGLIGAIGPIMRGEVKVRHSEAQVGRDYDYLLMGHYHQTLWLPRAIVNNTLKGYCEYGRRNIRAVPSKPSQVLWFTHPSRGITAHWEVQLSDASMASGAGWVSWPKEAA